MASADIFGLTQPTLMTEPTEVVYVKRNWTDEWTWIPWLELVSATDAIAPDLGEATLKWRFGNIIQPNTGTAMYWDFLNIGGCYIGIDIYDQYGGAPLWIGLVPEETITPWGGYVPQGEQTFTCVGLEELLRRAIVTGAYAQSYSGVEYIDRPMQHNKREGRTGLGLDGNRSPIAINGLHYFYTPVSGGTDAAKWTHLDEANYLLGHFVNNSTLGPDWYLTGFTGALAQLEGVHNWENSSVFDALNSLISRRRGLARRVVTDGTGPIYLEVMSLFVSDNYDQGVIDGFGRNVEPTITIDRRQQYDQVHVIGGPLYMCCTFAVNDPNFATIKPLWTSELQAAYDAIDGGDSPADDDAQRQSEAFRAVYQRFGIDITTWNWTVNGFNLRPMVSDFGEIGYATYAPQHNGGRKFERTIPFQDTPLAGTIADYRMPFVLVQVEDEDENLRFAYVDKLDAYGVRGANVRLSDSDMSVYIEPPINHVAASGIWPEDDRETGIAPQYSYLTYYMTAMFAIDSRLRMLIPIPGNYGRNEVITTKLLKDDDAIAIIIAPGTVYDVDPTNPTALLTTGASAIEHRNDIERLRQKAIMAAEWYGQQRATVTANIRGIQLAHRPGSIVLGLMDAAGWTDVGTVVTRRTWNRAENMTTITTGFEEFDGA